MNDSKNSAQLFPAILATTVHDIKNSLGILLELIRLLAINLPSDQSQNFSQLEFEANRINHSLMQLLVVYKIDSSKFALEIDQFAAFDLIDEARSQQEPLSRLRGIDVQIDCGDQLLCFCDYPHITNALGTILNNALRYTKTTVLLSAEEVEGYLKFSIEDDGQGFPEYLLQAELDSGHDLDWVSGSTGLGLFFVSQIAGLHKNAERSGFVKIDNQSSLGGARFCLFLP